MSRTERELMRTYKRLVTPNEPSKDFILETLDHVADECLNAKIALALAQLELAKAERELAAKEDFVAGLRALSQRFEVQDAASTHNSA